MLLTAVPCSSALRYGVRLVETSNTALLLDDGLPDIASDDNGVKAGRSGSRRGDELLHEEPRGPVIVGQVTRHYELVSSAQPETHSAHHGWVAACRTDCVWATQLS